MQYDPNPIHKWHNLGKLPKPIDLSQFPMTFWILKSTNGKCVCETVGDRLGLCVFGSESAAQRYKDDAIATLKGNIRNFAKGRLNELIESRKSLHVSSASYKEIEQLLSWNRKVEGWTHFITEEEIEGEAKFRSYMTLYNEKAAIRHRERTPETLKIGYDITTKSYGETGR